MGIKTYANFGVLGPPRVRLQQVTTPTSLATGVYTGIAWDQVNEDPWGMLVTPANVSVQAPIDGLYLCDGVVAQGAHAPTNRFFVALQFGGAQYRGTSIQTIVAGNPTTGVTRFMRLLKGQFINLAAFQDSGGALNTGITENVPYFNVTWVSR